MTPDVQSGKTFDVVVVGGGPAGLTAARHARREGATVLVIEQHGAAGDAARCAGLVSPRTIEALAPSSLDVLRSFRSAWIVGPSGRRSELRATETKAIAIDRAQLNRQLAADAIEEGIVLRTHSRVVSWRKGNVVARCSDTQTVERFRSSVTIGADGPFSRIATWAGLTPPQERVFAQQAVLTSLQSPVDEIEVFVGQDIAPGFFAWAVPAQPGTLRVGLGVSDARVVRSCFQQHLMRFPGRIVPGSHVGGAIPVDAAPRTVAPGVLLVGDAAGQVKPLSGGGLFVGACCARIAGRIAARAARARSVERRDHELLSYETSWRRLIGRELRLGRTVHRTREELSDRQLKSVLDLIEDPGIQHVLRRSGDIDYISRMVAALARRVDLWPGVVRRLAPLLGNITLQKMRHDADDAAEILSGL